MKLNFRNIAKLNGVLCFTLALFLTFKIQLLLSSWGVEFSYPTGLVGRRAAALFMGIGIMFIMARNAEPSHARSAMIMGMVVAYLLLAVLGIFEFSSGHARAGILVAVFIEILLVLTFLYVACVEKTQLRED